MSSNVDDRRAPVQRMSKDPVCGMDVDGNSEYAADHDGMTYHFCSQHCRSRFVADPAAFTGGSTGVREHLPPAAGTEATGADASPEAIAYTCPMHPEIRQDGPGSCPICGMALEPLVVTADAGPSAELHDMSRRFWIGLALAVPVVVVEMGGHLVSRLSDLISPTASTWIQLVLATPVVLWAGWPFFVRGWASVRTRNLNMFTLIAMGTGVAWVFSLIATLAPGIFPDSFRSMGAVDVYFEPAAVIIVLVLLGQVLELRAREQTSGAIRALLDLTPKTARRVGDDASDEEVALEDVQIGDRLRVRPGERVPVDGTVTEGRSSVD
ncbi:MAG: heavy metal-binding domain-containing protein, partial [Lapillicoccus sp.]